MLLSSHLPNCTITLSFPECLKPWYFLTWAPLIRARTMSRDQELIESTRLSDTTKSPRGEGRSYITEKTQIEWTQNIQALRKKDKGISAEMEGKGLNVSKSFSSLIRFSFWCGPFFKSSLNLLKSRFCFMFCLFDLSLKLPKRKVNYGILAVFKAT